MNGEVLRARRQAVLYDKKWLRLLDRAWIFRWIPFVEMAFAAGSMATGKVFPSSDFDILVAAKYGRMFTGRFFLILALDIFRWRRKNLDHGEAAADTICLNHFITEKSYALSPPHQAYWKTLYQNLVPIYGREEKIEEFYLANAWMGERRYGDDLRHKFRTASTPAKFFERILSGKVGDMLEQILRGPQLRRINEKLLPHAGYKPRLIVSDKELELHLDTRRIEE